MFLPGDLTKRCLRGETGFFELDDLIIQAIRWRTVSVLGSDQLVIQGKLIGSCFSEILFRRFICRDIPVCISRDQKKDQEKRTDNYQTKTRIMRFSEPNDCQDTGEIEAGFQNEEYIC